MTITRETGTVQAASAAAVYRADSGGTGVDDIPASTDDDESRDIAARIGRDFPDWLVLWGTYTRQFVAFPLFRAPPGAFVTAHRPGALTARIRDTELRLGISPAEGSTNVHDA
jgi:hypothetical protein